MVQLHAGMELQIVGVLLKLRGVLLAIVQGLQAMGIARAANVKMAFGSDLLGAMHK